VALTGALAALRARVRWERGDVVDASLQDGVLAQLTMNSWSEKRVSFMRSGARTGGLDLGHTRTWATRACCATSAAPTAG
jgi:crotonobetainyl-CoA:carnitine CoA-transferase CaiB-like acyl-CoA transferase